MHKRVQNKTAISALAVASLVPLLGAQETESESESGSALARLLAGRFEWNCTEPLVLPAVRKSDPCHGIKDPSVVRFDGRWHLFCSIRSQKRTHQIEYLSFRAFKDAGLAERHVLTISEGFFCAPQVFYFRPQEKWYLIYQARDQSWQPLYQPAFSTNADIADPESWTKPEPLLGHKPENLKAWLDFWVICDEKKAHLFFTSLDGKMWRAETRFSDFPKGWSRPEVALRGRVFEASHTYKLEGTDKYLTVIEAQRGHGWRYNKAYLADALDGKWKPLAASKEHAFASMKNVHHGVDRWTDCISHGELLRAGYDERLVVDPKRLRFLFQGVTNKQRRGKKYGEIPWRLGLLEAVGGPGR